MRERTWRRLLTAAAALVLAGASAGCTAQRQIMRFEDHPDPEAKMSRLEIMKVQSYVFTAIAEHQFWLCRDAGDVLECARACGGDTDIACPTAASAGTTVSTNTR